MEIFRRGYLFYTGLKFQRHLTRYLTHWFSNCPMQSMFPRMQRDVRVEFLDVFTGKYTRWRVHSRDWKVYENRISLTRRINLHISWSIDLSSVTPCPGRNQTLPTKTLGLFGIHNSSRKRSTTKLFWKCRRVQKSASRKRLEIKKKRGEGENLNSTRWFNKILNIIIL